ncbi:MAG: phosphoribosyltransferase family protein [Bdellovibrionia bacterium]
MRVFKDREEAGKSLADELNKEPGGFALANSIVIALPRGGVPVAAEISRRLKAPLDVLITRKIGAPDNPEYGIGAISENGTFWINENAVYSLGLSEIEVRNLMKREESEIRRRVHEYRGDRPITDIRDRTVILVDDGLATGVTARVSIQALREMGAERVVLAIPVGAPDTVEAMAKVADQVICLELPQGFYSVGSWYENFEQTNDEEVIELLSESRKELAEIVSKEIEITDGRIKLPGILKIPPNAKGIVLFAHGSGSSRHSPRNIQVADELNHAGMATLLFDLLDPVEALDRSNVFDIPFLADRLVLAFTAVRQRPETFELPVGFFGASTGGGAALWAAASLGHAISGIVSRGGRPDLAMEKLPQIDAPTLLIVGGFDPEVIELNRAAHAALPHSKMLIVAGATHLFEEPGTLEAVADAARDWFLNCFEKSAARHAA